MDHRRRRTDRLDIQALPDSPEERASTAARVLVGQCGFAYAAAVRVEPDGHLEVLAGAGRDDYLTGYATTFAIEAVDRGRAFEMQDIPGPLGLVVLKCAVIPCGQSGLASIAVLVCDEKVTRREGEAVAAWVAGARPGEAVRAGGPCGRLARDLAVDFDADAVTIALFARAGMLVNLHVRSGARLRAWRQSIDCVWAEAAYHHAAFLLGDLPMHPGAEHLASLGMRSAAIVGLENRDGMPIGSIGIASVREIDQAVVHLLIERAREIGSNIVELRSGAERRVEPVAAGGGIDLQAFARRVGCRRFAVYVEAGSVLQMVSAHAEDGRLLMTQPDPLEAELVRWAAERGIAVASEDAAAVLVGNGTVLYARDPGQRPIERLRYALHDLHGLLAPDPEQGSQGDEGRRAA